MRVVCHAPETAKAVDFALRHVRFTPESGTPCIFLKTANPYCLPRKRPWEATGRISMWWPRGLPMAFWFLGIFAS